MVFLLIQIPNSLRGLYLVNELATMAEVFKELAQMKSFSGFAFTYSLSASFIQCLLDQFRQCLKTDILPTCDFCICLKDTQVRSFLSHSADHIVDTNTIVSHKYAPPFATLALVQMQGGLYAGCDNFSRDYALPSGHCRWGVRTKCGASPSARRRDAHDASGRLTSFSVEE